MGCHSFWLVESVANINWLTCRPCLSFLSLLIGGSDSDCSYLFDNDITELTPTLFDKLINLRTLYVPWMLPCPYPLWTVLR